MWDEVSAWAAVASFLVSLGALWVALSGAKSSLSVATEALTTARQANDIALGKLREPSIVEFAFSYTAGKDTFDFTDPKVLIEPLEQFITLHNVGKTNVDAIHIEVIGLAPLTYLLDDPTLEIRPLPSIDMDVKFKSVLQPNGLVNIDIRKMILEYLVALEPKLEEKHGVYTTAINVVLAPKSISEDVAIGATSDLTRDDRRLLVVKFFPALIETPEAREILSGVEVKTRVLAP
ncbi:hypothetical protein ICY20_12425 [Pseudomonas sp. P115]|uniref:hypothetical protein n=1 Tax=Pseudomonas pisciculturae TaxID=2730413 RepID=UPI00189204B5|nr:hypothetical protein [Pseudomonas pisciculturae]MBF6028540.1 hypothetical protein [Pseudomonas pisciculturae]